MPLYEYQCTACGERAEILQQISDPPYSRCPKCGGDLKKLHSAPAIQFKGSGFYKTDYASTSTAEVGRKVREQIRNDERHKDGEETLRIDHG